MRESRRGRTDRASLLIHCDGPTVFSALSLPEALAQWLPPTGMRGHFEHYDFREGGSFRMVLTYEDAKNAPGKSSADADISQGRFVDIGPGELIVQEIEFESDDPAFHGTMTMEWSLYGIDEGTIVQIIARNVPEGIGAADHAAGLTSSLANLAAYLEG
ncbi:MAG: SRPBCC domain-containing protein [Gulosibacter sp.]|uniref:SRPBCC domain-containing protein n=1 Tax=Gulosibacter sp. TaxID=2817531 RepID=UPI003F8E48CC